MTYLTLTPPSPVNTNFSDPITVPAELVENRIFLFGVNTENLEAAMVRPVLSETVLLSAYIR